MDKKQDTALLFDFLKILPEEKLLVCVNSLIESQNRLERRNFQKHKELDEKLKFILNVMNYRAGLFEFIYENFKDDFEIDDSLSYDDILENMNSANCIDSCIYILYKCCDTAFEKKYFSTFLESEQFQKTIKMNGII